MGSLVAQQVALATPERVARLVLVGAAANPRNINGVFELQEAFDALEDPVSADFAREFQASTAYQPLPDSFLDRVVAESLKVPARVWRAALAGVLAADYTAHLGRIQAPTLILWGDKDAYFPRTEQDVLAAGLADAVSKVYPKTGHALDWQWHDSLGDSLREYCGERLRERSENGAPVHCIEMKFSTRCYSPQRHKGDPDEYLYRGKIGATAPA